MVAKVTAEPVVGSKQVSRVWLVVGAVCILLLLTVFMASVVLLQVSERTLNRLSDAGQAFGVLSALFSAMALIGVALSVIYQVRQNRRYDYEVWHTAHASLLQRVIEDPKTFAPCIGDIGRFGSEKEAKQYYFTTLWLNFGQIGLRSGNFSEDSVREEMCADMFESRVARGLWIKRRAALTASYGGLSPFYQLVNEEFEKSINDASVSPSGHRGEAPPSI